MVKEVASGGGGDCGESGLTSSLASYYVVKEVDGAAQKGPSKSDPHDPEIFAILGSSGAFFITTSLLPARVPNLQEKLFKTSPPMQSERVIFCFGFCFY